MGSPREFEGVPIVAEFGKSFQLMEVKVPRFGVTEKSFILVVYPVLVAVTLRIQEVVLVKEMILPTLSHEQSPDILEIL